MKLYYLIYLLFLSVLLPAQERPRVIYQDSFDSFNENFWEKSRGTFKNNLAYFHPDNANIKNGKLEFTLEVDRRRKGRYVGAQIRSKRMLYYGRYEIKVKPAKGGGLLNAFFLMGTSGEIGHEIDIEFMGKNYKKLLTNYWDKDGNEFPKMVKLGFDASQDYHTYAFEWTQESITWFVDGKKIREVKRRIPDEPMHLYINLWVSIHKHWAGEISDDQLPLKALFDDLKIIRLD